MEVEESKDTRESRLSFFLARGGWKQERAHKQKIVVTGLLEVGITVKERRSPRNGNGRCEKNMNDK